MADNVSVKDAAAATVSIATKDIGGVQYPLALSDSTEVTATFTRPADTTAYAAGDAVCNSTSAPAAMAFTSAANRNGGTITIMAATLYSSRPTNAIAMDLLLFNGSAAPTATNDNAALAPSDADADDCCGIINFPVANQIAMSNNKIWVATSPLGLTIKCDAGTSTVWGLLRASAAYTPDNAEVFLVTLEIMRD